MPLRDLYAALGLTTGASLEELKAAYRALAQKHHPDKPGGDVATFQRIQKAYDILKDPEKSHRYATLGDAAGKDEHSMALSTLANILTQVVSQVNVEGTDVHAVMRSSVLDMYRRADADIQRVTGAIARFREAARRMQNTEGEENLLSQVLLGQAEQHEKALAGHVQQQRVAALMDNMLEKYSYTHVAPATAPTVTRYHTRTV